MIFDLHYVSSASIFLITCAICDIRREIEWKQSTFLTPVIESDNRKQSNTRTSDYRVSKYLRQSAVGWNVQGCAIRIDIHTLFMPKCEREYWSSSDRLLPTCRDALCFLLNFIVMGLLHLSVCRRWWCYKMFVWFHINLCLFLINVKSLCVSFF